MAKLSKLEKEIDYLFEGITDADDFKLSMDTFEHEYQRKEFKKLVLKYMRRAYNAGKNPPTTLGRPAQENFSAYVKRIKL